MSTIDNLQLQCEPSDHDRKQLHKLKSEYYVGTIFTGKLFRMQLWWSVGGSAVFM